MKSEMEEMVYETPQVKMIEVEVENGFAQSGEGEGEIDELT